MTDKNIDNTPRRGDLDPTMDSPRWLLEAIEGIAPILQRLDDSERALRQETPDEFSYRHVSKKWLNPIQDQLLSRIRQQRRTGKLESTPAVIYAQLCENSSMVSMVDQAIFTRSIGIQRQLRAARTFLASDDLVNAFLMYRGVIELVAHFFGTYRLIATIEIPDSFKEANQLWAKTQENLLKRTFGTRIDWKDLLTEDAKEKLASKRSKEIEYTPAEDRVDLSAKSIMNELDKLNKKIPKIRKTYDVLCEFLHPNAGTMLAITSRIDLEEEEITRVPFVYKTLSTSGPYGFASEASPLIHAIFAQVATVSEFFIDIRKRAVESREVCLALAQQNIRHLLSKQPSLQFPYAPCPCGSGHKLRFCCGAK
jgi:hypothetical protein